MTGVLIAVGIVIVIAIALVIIGLRNPETLDERALLSRLDELSQSGQEFDLEQIELSQPFTERVIFPIARSLGKFAERFTPQNALLSIEKKLDLAGISSKIDPSMVLMAQFAALGIFGGGVFLIFMIGTLKLPLGQRLLYSLIFGGLGFYFPQLMIGSRISRRQKDIQRALPDALDLLTICVEAGLGFDAAMNKVAQKWQSELSLSFGVVIKEIQLGKLRKEALRDMSLRIGLSEMTSFTAAVIQSEMLGVSLAKVLRIQSDQMRVKRRQRAEEEAHKAPIKMLVPMGLLIFPSLMIVLLTPAALKLFHSALGDMFG
ncbi:MAG: type II secretion system F family protein [Anaerolineaceae bacterium]|nr:type II secretion system F family protein [Anaerolineaceae bacterium]